MSLFVKPKDYAFFQGVNRELLDDIIDTSVIIYSVDKESTKSNLYGESAEKIFLPGLKVRALIQHDAEMTDEEDGFGPNVYQNLRIAFHRDTLKEKDFYPERGDYLKWNASYFEIGGVEDNQLIAGRQFEDKTVPTDTTNGFGLPHSIICMAHMVDKSVINVRTEVS